MEPQRLVTVGPVCAEDGTLSIDNVVETHDGGRRSSSMEIQLAPSETKPFTRSVIYMCVVPCSIQLSLSIFNMQTVYWFISPVNVTTDSFTVIVFAHGHRQRRTVTGCRPIGVRSIVGWYCPPTLMVKLNCNIVIFELRLAVLVLDHLMGQVW